MEDLLMDLPSEEIRVDGATFVEIDHRSSWVSYEEEPFYRYTCHADYNSRTGEYDLTVWLEKYGVLRYTPCGAWVDGHGKERFCLNGPGKRFAHRTKEDAMASFHRRSIWRQRHARRSLTAGELAETWAKKQLEKENGTARPT